MPDFLLEHDNGCLHVEPRSDGGHILFIRTQDGATAWSIGPADSLRLSRYLEREADDSAA